MVNDERWNHIKAMCEEYSKMAGFVRATRNGQFNEATQRLISEGINHYQSLRETLGKMRGHRGYNAYFENWTPPLMEDDTDTSNLNELFVQETIDPRIESVMPILSKLQKNLGEMKEVQDLEEWASGLIEDEGLAAVNPVGIPENVVDTVKKGVKKLSRGMKGWGVFDKDKPADVVNRVKGQDTDTLKTLSNPGSTGKGSPAELQQKAISRELKKRGLGQEEQLDELSSETLKSYHKKAVGQLTKGDVPTKKFDKRESGAIKAFKKAYDQKDVTEGLDTEKRARLDDLISQYRDAIDPEQDYYSGDDIYDEDEVIATIRQEFGDKVADQVQAGAAKMHYPRHGIQRSDPLGWKKPADRITKAGKMYKQDSDYRKNTIKSRYKLSGRSATEGMAEGMAEGSGPELGTVKANLMNTQQPTVQVQVFKHNTLRGDSYWVTKEVRKFKTMDQAQAYVDRINKKGVAEDLDANQKRVGQLGPTEKVGSKGTVGKLVGANESVEHDELAAIKRLLGK
jgi:hypothetical protein